MSDSSPIFWFFVAIILFLLLSGCSPNGYTVWECDGKGGTMVQSARGWVCIDNKGLILPAGQPSTTYEWPT